MYIFLHQTKESQMGKNRLGLHSVTIVVIALFAFLAISSTSSTPTPKTLPSVGEETIARSITTSDYIVNDMPVPEPAAGKQFDVLGLVFATSVSEVDEKGQIISNQEGIVTMLLREAQKLGGNDILNLRVDENTIFIQTQVISEGSSGKTTKVITTKKVTYTGSALAIKHRNDESNAKR
jgi:hypothetical protein